MTYLSHARSRHRKQVIKYNSEKSESLTIKCGVTQPRSRSHFSGFGHTQAREKVLETRD